MAPSSGANGVNLFRSETATAPIYVIPSGQPLKVTIVYDVETKDSNLPTYLSDGSSKGTSVQNTITKTITTGSGASTSSLKLEVGKQYTVKLHLGMTSVKFNASISDNWGDTKVNGSADLPANK